MIRAKLFGEVTPTDPPRAYRSETLIGAFRHETNLHFCRDYPRHYCRGFPSQRHRIRFVLVRPRFDMSGPPEVVAAFVRFHFVSCFRSSNSVKTHFG
jgi:hypothetical protein